MTAIERKTFFVKENMKYFRVLDELDKEKVFVLIVLENISFKHIKCIKPGFQ